MSLAPIGPLAIALCLIAANRAAAQTAPILRVDGDHFTVNGDAKFLLFVSYFDGLRASGADRDADFAHLRSIGIDGVRVMPNWSHYGCGQVPGSPALDDALFTTAAALRESRWVAFVDLLNRAAFYNLLVDVTFTRETITGTNTGVGVVSYTGQIREVARRLSGAYPHVLFDLQNEYNEHELSTDDIKTIVAAVRAEDRPGVRRIVTASTSGSGQRLAGELARDANLDFVALHDPRDPDTWYTNGETSTAFTAARTGMSTPVRPIHFQEPMPFAKFDPSCVQTVDDVPTHHRLAAGAAKTAGAAAWTFHTRTTFALHNGSYRAKLESRKHEQAEIEALRASVNAASWGIQADPPRSR
jgi:hypothetical protein